VGDERGPAEKVLDEEQDELEDELIDEEDEEDEHVAEGGRDELDVPSSPPATSRTSCSCAALGVNMVAKMVATDDLAFPRPPLTLDTAKLGRAGP
jgi:hypothetical protein